MRGGHSIWVAARVACGRRQLADGMHVCFGSKADMTPGAMPALTPKAAILLDEGPVRLCQ